MFGTKQTTQINNNNIREFVDYYIEDKNKLPNDLKKIRIGNWNVSEVSDMSKLFMEKTEFNEDISKWNTSKVTNMSYMFWNTSKFNQNISKWDVSNVTNMYGMFANASNFNQNLSKWRLKSIKNIAFIFANASKFNQNIDDWDNWQYFIQRNIDNFDNMMGMLEKSGVTNIPRWTTKKYLDEQAKKYEEHKKILRGVAQDNRQQELNIERAKQRFIKTTFKLDENRQPYDIKQSINPDYNPARGGKRTRKNKKHRKNKTISKKRNHIRKSKKN